jgi:cell division protease FtsH
LGPIAYGGNHDTVFLGRDITSTESISEDTARRIDAEIQRIISEQYERAKAIISERRSALDKIAEALLEHETLEGGTSSRSSSLARSARRSPLPSSASRSEKPEEKKAADKPAPAEGLGAGPLPPRPRPDRVSRGFYPRGRGRRFPAWIRRARGQHPGGSPV